MGAKEGKNLLFNALDWFMYMQHFFYLMNVCFTLSLPFDLLQTPLASKHFVV